MAGAELEDATFWGANLSGANLEDTEGLEQEQLDPACGDAKTVLPDDLLIKMCR